MPQPSNTNGLAQQTDPSAPSDIKGVFVAITNWLRGEGRASSDAMFG
jgi:hypothetical protein